MKGYKISRVVFLGNLLRFSEHKPYQSNQNENIAWVANNLRPIFEHWLNIPTDLMFWDRSGGIDVPSIYGSYDLSLNKLSFAQLINEECNDAVCDCFSDLSTETLVVGFEMPKLFLDAFDRLGVPFIDLMLGPIRFLPDLQIGIRTNRKKWFDRIMHERQPNKEIYYYAGSFQAKISRLPKIKYQRDSLLVVGQVSDDVSLIRNGDYVNFSHVSDVLKELVAGGLLILFKPHPYASAEQIRAQVKLLKSIGDVSVTLENIYRLILSDSVNKVVALTSSVVIESRFFETDSEFLSVYPFRLSTSSDFDSSAYTLTHNKIVKPSFWAKLLDRSCDPDPSPEKVGLLRDTLGRSWGYDLGETNQSNSVKLIEWVYGRLVGKKGKKLLSRFRRS